MSNTLQYRPNVGIVIFNSDKNIWIGKRLDNNTKEGWQLPQGGIDYQEEPLDAAIREVYEETGITTIKNIATIDNWIKYNLPLDIAKNKFSDDGLNIHTTTNKGFKKVPIIWSGAERAHNAKNTEIERDGTGMVTLPVISIERDSIKKTDASRVIPYAKKLAHKLFRHSKQ